MCGICGFAGFYDNELLRKMTASIIHRGPDGEGIYEKRPVMAMGMRRLAIIDLKTGDQPIYNEDKSIAVVFNGEIYNFVELRDQLIAKGHSFCTKTDTEVIVHLYEEYGEDCAKHMRGMFAFSIWDDRKRKLIISRDQLGIKPLFYSFSGGKLLFGSEIKCILQHSGASRSLNYKALDYYFTFMYIPAPYCIFDGINKLPLLPCLHGFGGPHGGILNGIEGQHSGDELSRPQQAVAIVESGLQPYGAGGAVHGVVDHRQGA